MLQKLERTFGTWRKAGAAVPTAPTPARVTGRPVLLVDKPGATQTYFWLGSVGASRTDPARTAQSVVNTVFGGRFTSMLNTELRMKSGLTYGASSSFSRPSQPGSFHIASYTETSKTTQAIDMTLDTLARLHKNGLDADQLKSSQSYMLGQFPPSIETNGQIAGRLADMLFYRPRPARRKRVRGARVEGRRGCRSQHDRAVVSATGEPRDSADRRRRSDSRYGEEVRPGDGDEDHRSALCAGDQLRKRTALVAGASGLVGGECLKRLLASDAYSMVTIVTRRSLGSAAEHPRAREVIVDFEDLDSVRTELRADHVFCALGTTIRKAGSQAKFRQVDFEYPRHLAELVLANDAKHFSLVSALGASSKSGVFYSRVKGELEDVLRGMGWPSLCLLRPSVIAGDRQESRPIEWLTERLLRFAPHAWRPVPASTIASAMVATALRAPSGVTIIESGAIGAASGSALDGSGA